MIYRVLAAHFRPKPASWVFRCAEVGEVLIAVSPNRTQRDAKPQSRQMLYTGRKSRVSNPMLIIASVLAEASSTAPAAAAAMGMF